MLCFSFLFTTIGSPPRMRGKVHRRRRQHAAPGITPAYAGKRPRNRNRGLSFEDHPRVCGEKICKAPEEVEYGRITPAYAGKSRFCSMLVQAMRDHPRVCGEKAAGCLDLSRPTGSPPRMRGKDKVIVDTELIDGITPAYAGKRGRREHKYSDEKDHPRVCGEKRRQMAPVLSHCGITPAYAGKRFFSI